MSVPFPPSHCMQIPRLPALGVDSQLVIIALDDGRRFEFIVFGADQQFSASILKGRRCSPVAGGSGTQTRCYVLHLGTDIVAYFGIRDEVGGIVAVGQCWSHFFRRHH